MLKSICIVAHFAYGAMTKEGKGHIGGVERQTTLMSHWFAGKGYRVSLLTWDEGQEEEVNMDGVRVIRLCQRDEGFRIIRFFHPRWTSLVKAMKKADADLYYQNCAEYVTGQVAHWCRRNDRRFVYSVASDPDCDPRLPKMRTMRERVLYRYGLSHADRIIVQTETQRSMLMEGFGLDSVTLPMPCLIPTGGDIADLDSGNNAGSRVLWVGRISKVKRLELLLDIASILTGVTFDIACAPDGAEEYSRELLLRARSLPNVNVLERVPWDHMAELYRNASILCCTSMYEGFPNTFLEAWSFGVPILSTVDPDGIIATRKLGITCSNCSEVIKSIRTLLDSPELMQEISLNARRYYLDNHTVEGAMRGFEKLFLNVMNL